MKEAKEQGAGSMVTPCPLCSYKPGYLSGSGCSYGKYRAQLTDLACAQLLGLAMGIPAKDLGLSHHLISVDSILARIPHDGSSRNR